MSSKELDLIIKATQETLYMTAISMLYIAIVGLLIGIVLYSTKPKSLYPNKFVYQIVSFIINAFRAVPFAVLVALLFPFSKLVIGSMIGTKAMLPALIIGGSPFFARTVENALSEVDHGLVEAGYAMGASKPKIIKHILLQEARPSLISSLTLTTISIIGYTAMAGLIGGGGLGYLAINYGLYRDNLKLAYVTSFVILVIVLVIQWLGNYLSKKTNKK